MPVAAVGRCEAGDHRQFDFWLGDWNVYAPDGKLAGVNSISSEYEGCVLHERYSTDRGFSGESLNAYDPVRKVWHQTWVDSSGTLLLLEGGLRFGYVWDDNKYEIAAFGRNITNEVVAVGAIDFNNLTGFTNEPQIWGVQFKAKF